MADLSISLSEDLRTFMESQVKRLGLSSISEYLERLLREAQRHPSGPGSALHHGSESSEAAPWDVAVAVGASVPEHVWSGVPTDLARNVDHYLYGAARED